MHPHTRRKTKKKLGRLTPRNNRSNDFVQHLSAAVPAVPLAVMSEVRDEDAGCTDAEIAALFKSKDAA